MSGLISAESRRNKAALAAPDGGEGVGIKQNSVYATPRTAKEKLSVFVDDLDFSGTLAEKLNHAYEFIYARTGGEGGEIKLPAGAVRTIAPGEIVDIKPGVSLIGTGYRGTEINVQGLIRFEGNGTNGAFSVRGITINADGNPGYALEMKNFREVDLEGMFVYHAQTHFESFSYLNMRHYKHVGGGVVMTAPVNKLNEAPHMHICNFSDAFLTTMNTTDVEISSSRFLGPASTVAIRRGQHNSDLYVLADLSNVVFDSQENFPLIMEGVTPRVANTFLSGGRLRAASGIYMDDCTEGSLKGVGSRFNGGAGIEIRNSRNIDLIGCHLNDNMTSGARLYNTDGIKFYGGSAQNAARWYGGSYVQAEGIVSPDGSAINTNVEGVDVRNIASAANRIYLPDSSNKWRACQGVPDWIDVRAVLPAALPFPSGYTLFHSSTNRWVTRSASAAVWVYADGTVVP